MATTPCIACPHVLTSERPVHALVHHEDGTWQATCGARDHAHDCSDFDVICLEHLLERQPNLIAATSMQPNFVAELTREGWFIAEFEESEAE